MNPPPSTDDPASPGLVRLAPECVLAGIQPLHAQLLAAQQLPTPVTLDVGGLERIDAATMQLVLTFILDRAAAERALQIRGASPAWDEAVNTLGLSQLLLVAA